MMAQQSFQYTLLLNKLAVSFSNTDRYCIFWSHHPTQNDVKCGFMPLLILQEKHTRTVTYYAFSSEITLDVVEFREHVVQTATQED